MGCGGPGLYYQNAALQTSGGVDFHQNGHGDIMGSGGAQADETTQQQQGRPRRERKANLRYQGNDFGSLDDMGGGGDRGDGAASGGGSQHSGKSSRDKTYEVASAPKLGLSKSVGDVSALDDAGHGEGRHFLGL